MYMYIYIYIYIYGGHCRPPLRRDAGAQRRALCAAARDLRPARRVGPLAGGAAEEHARPRPVARRGRAVAPCPGDSIK